VDALYKGMEKEIDGLERTINDKFNLNSEAVNKATDVMNERLLRMNEFRDQINRERSDYLTKEMFEALNKPIIDRLSKLESRSDYERGRDTTLITIVGLLTGVGGAILGYVLKYLLH
jgi:hypothetical protein